MHARTNLDDGSCDKCTAGRLLNKEERKHQRCAVPNDIQTPNETASVHGLRTCDAGEGARRVRHVEEAPSHCDDDGEEDSATAS